MISSLRSRQLISGFGVIMVGILMLGSMLHYFSYRYKIEQVKSGLEQISYNLLGFLNFQDGKFDVIDDPDIKAQAKQKIEEYNLNDVEQNRFAYVIDTKSGKIIWNAANFGKPSEMIDPDYYLLFDLGKERAASYKPFFDQAKPLPPKNALKADADPTIKQKYNQEYLLAAQNFFQEPYGHFQFIVGVSIADIDKEMQDMRQKFAILLFLSAVLVLIAQLALSFWVVAPIKEFENEVKSIEAGERETINDHYPEELIPVKNALNGLLSYEKGQKQRYKDTLDDLAHSIKTPLTAMQNQLDHLNREFGQDPQLNAGLKVFESQIARMREIVGHQLRRAMVTNQGAMILSQPVRPVLFRLRDTLQKVYRDKPFEFRLKAGRIRQMPHGLRRHDGTVRQPAEQCQPLLQGCGGSFRPS